MNVLNPAISRLIESSEIVSYSRQFSFDINSFVVVKTTVHTPFRRETSDEILFEAQKHSEKQKKCLG